MVGGRFLPYLLVQRLFVLLLLLMDCHATTAAAPQPFTVQDLVALQRVSDLSVSPNGQFAAFTIREWARIPSSLLLLLLSPTHPNETKIQTKRKFKRNKNETKIKTKRHKQDGKGSTTNLHLLDITKGETRRVTTKQGVSDNSPRWSPDSTRLAFLSSRSGSSQARLPPGLGRSQVITRHANQRTGVDSARHRW